MRDGKILYSPLMLIFSTSRLKFTHGNPSGNRVFSNNVVSTDDTVQCGPGSIPAQYHM